MRDLAESDVMAEAALISALEDRPLIFEGLEDIEPAERARLLRAIEARPERTVLAAPTRTAALALGERTVLLVEAGPPSFAERRQAWADLTGVADDRRRRRQVPALDDADRRGRRGGAAVRRRRAAPTRRSRATSTPAPARPPPRGWASSPPASRPATSGRTSSSRPSRPSSCSRSAPTCATATACSRDWGYEQTVSRTQGLKVLFAGESGTGKTMGAQVIAAELGLEIFRVDLATTVSKYIGETEKNLDRIFGAAEGSNAILFFDEADALFGKRSEIGDSHDRYANIEVAYLLQKMEGYPGAVILATNFRRNIDDAFVRRLDFVIDFPFPEKEDRTPHLAEGPARRGAARRRHRPRLPVGEVQALRRRDPQLLAVRRLPGRRRGLRRSRMTPPRPRRRERVRQAGPAHAGGRLRALPRRDQGAARAPPTAA